MVLSYNGEPIDEVRDLTKMVADTDPGTAAEVVVWRDGKEMTLDVEIGEMPGTTRWWLRPSSRARPPTARPGSASRWPS